jgi:hypothetical protein
MGPAKMALTFVTPRRRARNFKSIGTRVGGPTGPIITGIRRPYARYDCSIRDIKDGLLDPSEVMTFADSNLTARTLVPIGTAEINTGTRGDPRVLNTVLSSSARDLRSSDVLTVQVLYRSVESGTHGAIQEFTSGTFYDDNRVQVTLSLK